MLPNVKCSDIKSISDDERTPISWKPIAPDGGYGWVVVFGAFLIHVFADGFVYSFGVIGQSLVKKYNYSNSEVSTILSLLSGLMYAVGIVAAFMCNKIGCRLTTIIGALLSAAGCCASYFSTRLIHLVFSIGVFMGLGLGLMYCPAIVIVTMYFEKNRSLATGITVCGSGVGTLVFAKLIAFFITLLEPDFLTIFPIYGGILLLCIPCGLLFKPVLMEPVYEDDSKKVPSNIREHGPVKKQANCLGKTYNFLGFYLFANPCYMVYLVSSVLVTAGFNAAPMFLPMNAEAVLNKEKQTAANTISFYGFANVLGRLFFGWVCDHQLPFKQGKDREKNRLWIFTAALILSGLSACFVFAMRNFVLYVVFCTFFGFAVSSYPVLTSVLLVDLIGIDQLTTGLGILLLFHGGACIAGPILGGHLYDVTREYGWTFALLGGCLLVGGVILPLTHLVPSQHKPVKEQLKREENSALIEINDREEVDSYKEKV